MQLEFEDLLEAQKISQIPLCRHIPSDIEKVLIQWENKSGFIDPQSWTTPFPELVC